MPTRATVTPPIRIVVVDDHPIVREGLVQVLSRADDLSVVAEVEDAPGALDAIARERPDLVIVDLSLKSAGNGLELTTRIRDEFGVPVLVLSVHDEAIYAERALRAGARGYVMKDAPTSTLLAAIRRILDGGIHVSDRMASQLLHRFGRTGVARDPTSVEALSDRELQVFRLLGQGLGTRQVAEQLHLSVKTIETYRANIKRKLRITTASELIRRAVAWNLIEGGG